LGLLIHVAWIQQPWPNHLDYTLSSRAPIAITA
jgi:hypothetical protein